MDTLEQRRAKTGLPASAAEGERHFFPAEMNGGGLPTSMPAESTDQLKNLMAEAERLESAGLGARSTGDESKAEQCFLAALGLATKAFNPTVISLAPAEEMSGLRLNLRLALRCGEADQARKLIKLALASVPALAFEDEWIQLRESATWPDEWLIGAIRREPPDVAALDALVKRHWPLLFGRCLVLTANHPAAADLAQDAWCRILRSRKRLKPGGNFPAYITTVATNLWRDDMRSISRAGLMARSRMSSLNEALPGDDENSATLMDILPDLDALQQQDRNHLALEIDQAMAQLPPLLRDVLSARFLNGETCLEIGRRHGRTQQTISGWIRSAIIQIRTTLENQGNTLKNMTHEK
ncbi:MAG TPA: sigma-70 family RNA polymerase sigma factor [Verrucomicrobiae bacterium]|nr:sigma-70 family RNA polymerase sigma factor [Verrucomicrobiae bacterium]